MSYYVADARGHVADLAAGHALHAFYDWLLRQDDAKLVALAEKGFTTAPSVVAQLLRARIKSASGYLAETIQVCVDALAKCDTIAIISDGVQGA